MRGTILGLLASLALVLSTPARGAEISAVRVAAGLASPVYLASPAGDPRLFVVERGGTIRIVSNGVVQPTPFLDITASVVCCSQTDEGGLLGLVFAPDYATSGVFYVYYTGAAVTSGPMRSIVSRFTASGDPPYTDATAANAASEQKLFGLDQPYPNHNGGTLAIRDGYLYLGLGDGGGAGDPEDRAQNDALPFGKMLRLDLSIPSPTNDDWQIWAKGFRNPYRFSFDRQTGDLYVGDVGQATEEEVDVVSASEWATPGLNFGWDVLEGTICFVDPDGGPDPGEPSCDDPTLVAPVYTFDHPPDPLPGGIVIGGAVYRGDASPSLRGSYFFADAGAGSPAEPDRPILFRMRWTADAGLLEPVETFPPAAIAVDTGKIQFPVAIAEGGDRELYVVGLFGQIHRLVPEPDRAIGLFAALGSLAGVARLRARCARI